MSYAIGIDPSLTGCAIAYIDGDVETVWTKAGEGDARLVRIYDAVALVANTFDIFAVVEDLPFHARAAGQTGLAHGVVRLALQRSKTPYILIPPATLKAYATGKGNATKADMRMSLYKRSGIDESDDNQVDALWLRDIGRYALGDPQALELPKAQRERLFKLDWPEEMAARMLEPYEVAEVEEIAERQRIEPDPPAEKVFIPGHGELDAATVPVDKAVL